MENRYCVSLSDGSMVWLPEEAYQRYMKGELDLDREPTPEEQERINSILQQMLGTESKTQSSQKPIIPLSKSNSSKTASSASQQKASVGVFVICPFCGKETEADGTFCEFCGSRITSERPDASGKTSTQDVKVDSSQPDDIERKSQGEAAEKKINKTIF